MPTASNHCATSRSSAAAPEMKNRSRPPEPLADGGEHQSVGELVLQRDRRRRLAAGLPGPRHLQADADRPVEDPLLEPAFLGDHALDAGVYLFEDARHRAHEGRAHRGEVVDDLLDAPVDRCREADQQRQRQHHLAERVRQRQPQVVQVVGAEDVQRVDGRGGVGPRLVGQPHPLRLARGAGGVDDAGQLARTDVVNAVVHRARGLGQQLLAALLELVEGDHPVAVALAVDDHHLLHVGQLGAVLDQFVDLGLILGDDDPAARVGDDERDVPGVGLRIHRGGGGTGAHHGEVDEHPFVACRGRQRDPVLGGDAQRDQPRREQATRSPTCCQVTLSQPSSCRYRNASACGVAATRSTNIWATDGARCSILERSGFSCGCNQACHVQSLEAPRGWETAETAAGEEEVERTTALIASDPAATKYKPAGPATAASPQG